MAFSRIRQPITNMIPVLTDSISCSFQ